MSTTAKDTFLLAIEAARRLRDMMPTEAEDKIRSAWVAHFLRYKSLEEGKRELITVEETVALLILNQYFFARGNWSAMIGNLEEQMRTLKQV